LPIVDLRLPPFLLGQAVGRRSRFGPGFHVYQYLCKSNCPDISFAEYDDLVVAAAIDQRRQFFEAKRERLLSSRDLLLHLARRQPVQEYLDAFSPRRQQIRECPEKNRS